MCLEVLDICCLMLSGRCRMRVGESWRKLTSRVACDCFEHPHRNIALADGRFLPHRSATWISVKVRIVKLLPAVKLLRIDYHQQFGRFPVHLPRRLFAPSLRQDRQVDPLAACAGHNSVPIAFFRSQESSLWLATSKLFRSFLEFFQSMHQGEQ